MKRILLVLAIALFSGCEAIGIKKRCYDCKTTYVSPRAPDYHKEICGDKDAETYRKETTGNVMGVIQQTVCTEK